MSEKVARFLGRYSAREVFVDGSKFDVVSYDKKENLFKLVECKLTSRSAGIGRTFGQLLVYHSTVAAKAFDFVNALSKKMPLSFHRLWVATRNGKKIKVQFYVALPHDACQRLDLIESLKRHMPHVGIIRVKAGGQCRTHLRRDGKRDTSICLARPVDIRILQPT